MNDRFKFRGFHPVLAKVQEIKFIDFIHNTVDFGDGDIFDIEEVKLHKSTGIKDKNGKLIYENDIVKVINPKYETFKKPLQVLYFNGMYYLQNKRTLNPLNWFFDNSINYLEIIGNIYENFNLLDIKLQESEVNKNDFICNNIIIKNIRF